MKFFSKEVQIALVAIASLVVLFFGLKFLKGLSLFSNDDAYYVTFDDISGLSESSPVYANGYQVGVVKEIRYNFEKPGKIVAVVGLNKAMRVPKGSTAELASDLLGNIKINLVLSPNPLEFMSIGDTISGGMQMGLMSKVGEMMPTIEAVIPKLDSIMASLNTILADPALMNTIRNAEVVTGNLTKTTNELNTLMAQVNREVPQMLQKANGVLDNTTQLTANLNQIDVAGTMAKVNMTLDNVEQMTQKLNSNEGSLGLLMRDPGLYNNLNATMRDADSLVIDFKTHPKRYIHFSVFGKKDK